MDDDIDTTSTERYENLEILTAIWLTTGSDLIKKLENKQFQAQIRSIIDYVKFFRDLDLCESYIKNAADEIIYLMVSSNLALSIVENVHNLSQVHQIYIYDINESLDQDEWKNKFQKVIMSVLK